MGYNDSISPYILIFCVQPQKVLMTKIRGTLSEICTLVKWKNIPDLFTRESPQQGVEKQWESELRVVNVFDNLLFRNFRSAKDLWLLSENFKLF